MASEAEDTPFERYLVSTTDSAFPPSYATGHWTVNDQPPASRTRAVQFQMPQFMQSGPPLLAQGGGVEVLPAAMFVKNNPNADWQPAINKYDLKHRHTLIFSIAMKYSQAQIFLNE